MTETNSHPVSSGDKGCVESGPTGVGRLFARANSLFKARGGVGVDDGVDGRRVRFSPYVGVKLKPETGRKKHPNCGACLVLR
jgi:hypothetical protein